jgi:hypothetical protein
MVNTDHYSDWRTNRTCQLCGREIPPGEWGYADGPLCHPDDPNLPDCYRLWTVYRKRRIDETRAEELAQAAQSEYAKLRSVEDLVDHARRISASPSMAIYVRDIEDALGIGDPAAVRPHKLGGNDDE